MQVEFWEVFKRGGIFMYPLLLCSILSGGIILERLIILGYRINPRSAEELLQILKKGSIEHLLHCLMMKNPLHRIIKSGIDAGHSIQAMENALSRQLQIEVFQLERGLDILATVGMIAPLVGFLGTVSGMLSAFSGILEAEYVSVQLVASGIYEALITTAFGLTIAIPTLIFYNLFVRRIDKFMILSQRLIQALIHKLR